jgi:hypothetical protein
MAMEPSIAQGVAIELDYLINEGWKGGWKFIVESDGFRIVPPVELTSKPDFVDALREYVWNVSAFVAYANYVSIELNQDGDYTMRSQMDSGHGYYIIFESKARLVPDPYMRIKQ